jgi:hypothetical protein
MVEAQPYFISGGRHRVRSDWVADSTAIGSVTRREGSRRRPAYTGRRDLDY